MCFMFSGEWCKDQLKNDVIYFVLNKKNNFSANINTNKQKKKRRFTKGGRSTDKHRTQTDAYKKQSQLLIMMTFTITVVSNSNCFILPKSTLFSEVDINNKKDVNHSLIRGVCHVMSVCVCVCALHFQVTFNRCEQNKRYRGEWKVRGEHKLTASVLVVRCEIKTKLIKCLFNNRNSQ